MHLLTGYEVCVSHVKAKQKKILGGACILCLTGYVCVSHVQLTGLCLTGYEVCVQITGWSVHRCLTEKKAKTLQEVPTRKLHFNLSSSQIIVKQLIKHIMWLSHTNH